MVDDGETFLAGSGWGRFMCLGETAPHWGSVDQTPLVPLHPVQAGKIAVRNPFLIVEAV